ncbi:hypothetical protein EDD17DRAFT_1638720 [Pisolithus thermaeus]|nr:hypothetical protein EDD17DRAFT_1638720 [Pisolithus thermaeus]
MTTWKSRLATSRNAGSEDDVDESLLNSCLFTYPVLQAADVLVYRVMFQLEKSAAARRTDTRSR